MDRIILKEIEEVKNAEVFEDEPQEGELTVINFIATPSKRFKSCWWVNVIPKIFIRPVGTMERLGLVYAHNIPLSPQKYYFKNETEELHFTLFFPALPKGTKTIHILEHVGGHGELFFNFTHVSVSRIKSAPLKK